MKTSMPAPRDIFTTMPPTRPRKAPQAAVRA